jgi:hypothetical protein
MQLRQRRIFLVCGLVLAALFAWIALSGPMLLHVHYGSMSGNPRLAIWNPIRNRTPEHYGVQLLSKIQSENCQQTVSALEISEQERVAACGKRTHDPLANDCSLVERVDSASSVWLLFRCPYRRATKMRAQVGLTLARQGAGWSLRSYDRVY